MSSEDSEDESSDSSGAEEDAVTAPRSVGCARSVGTE